MQRFSFEQILHRLGWLIYYEDCVAVKQIQFSVGTWYLLQDGMLKFDLD